MAHRDATRHGSQSMSVAAYIRVSTIGQNAEGQERAIQQWLKGNRVELGSVDWCEDIETGDTLERPGFAALQSMIFRGEVDTVVVWKLDRLSRSIRDGLSVLCDWSERGVRVVSVTQQIDLTGAVGRMIAAVLLGVAEMEQETRRERQAAGIEAARARGVYKGRQPGSTKADPERAMALRQRGLSDAEIAQALNVSRRSVQRYLRQAESRAN